MSARLGLAANAAGRRPPFVVDYTVDGRRFSFLLLGPESWADAEAHLAAIRATAAVEGSDVTEIPARAIDLFVEAAEALLAACAAAGRPDEMALTGAAVMTGSAIAAGLDRDQALGCATTMIDAGYRVAKP